MKRNITILILFTLAISYVYGLRVADLSETPMSQRPKSFIMTAKVGL
jgi:hypothetical protein